MLQKNGYVFVYESALKLLLVACLSSVWVYILCGGGIYLSVNGVQVRFCVHMHVCILVLVTTISPNRVLRAP